MYTATISLLVGIQLQEVYRKAPLNSVRDQLTFSYKLRWTFNKQVISPLLELPLQSLHTNYNVSIIVSA